jgi:hypothetical protein
LAVKNRVTAIAIAINFDRVFIGTDFS